MVVGHMASHIFQTIDSQMSLRQSSPPLDRIPLGRPLTFISARDLVGHSAAGKIKSTEISNDLIMDRIRDFTASPSSVNRMWEL
jgi:hypothetical protein